MSVPPALCLTRTLNARVAELVELVLSAATTSKVAVLGDFCVDAYWDIDATEEEYSLETGLPVQHVVGQRYELGGAANVAANLRAIGVEVRAVGLVGDDVFGTVLRSGLVGIGVDATGLRAHADRQTPVYVKRLIGGTEGSRLDIAPPRAVSAPEADAIVGDLRDVATWADVVLVNQQLTTCADPRVIAAVNAIAAVPGAPPVLVDSRDAPHLFQGVLLKLNRAEAQRLCGELLLREQGDAAQAAAISGHTGRPVFLTRGEAGMVVAERATVATVPGIDVGGPVDPVGAGDTVLAALGACLAIGVPASDAAHFANLAASVVVAKLRVTGVPTAAELRAAARGASYVFEAELAENPRAARWSTGGDVELINPPSRTAVVRHAVLDHDGTLSTLREGWEAVMVELMEECVIGPAGADDLDSASTRAVADSVRALIDRTTGAPTIVQMEGLVELVRARGRVPASDVLSSAEYKLAYTAKLEAQVRLRIERLAAGVLAPEDFQIKGSRALLELLTAQGIVLHLASGTDTGAVRSDAEALGYAHLFGDRIFGATDDPGYDAKQVVMAGIAESIGPDETFVVVGDGPVEMRHARRYGGIAIGLCSDERRRHEFNPAKRPRLIRAGADLLISDYSDPSELLGLLGIA